MSVSYAPYFNNYYACKYYFDPANTRSYIGSGTILLSLLNSVNATISAHTFSTEAGGVFVLSGNSSVSTSVTNYPANAVFAHTIEMVISPTGTPSGEEYIFQFGAAIDNNHSVIRTASNVLQIGVYATGGNIITHTYQMTVGDWYHIVSTYDGVTSKLYVNGVLISSAAATFNISSKVITMFSRFGFAQLFVGKAGVFRGYDITLSPEDVTAAFNSIRGRYGL